MTRQVSPPALAPLPPALRSRLQLEAEGVPTLRAGTMAPTDLPIAADGTTFAMAQETTWIDSEHFAVGRWDGSLSVFSFVQSAVQGPLITTAVNSPSAEGVQMIVWLAENTFVTSNDDESIVVWQAGASGWGTLERIVLLTYDASYGVANSGDAFPIDGQLYLVVGHANGYVTIWGGPSVNALTLVTAVDLRSAHPLNPWQLQNIRGVAYLAVVEPAGFVVTGSENGELCVLEIPSGTIRSRTVYNPNAQRGINSVAVSGAQLLVTNCSVGDADRNLWAYAINPQTWAITPTDSVNLRIDPADPQVFNFCAVWGAYSGGGSCFFSSTEEGALWMGTVGADGRITVLGYRSLPIALGAALAFNWNGHLVVTDYNLHEFTTFSQAPPAIEGNPERRPSAP